MSETRAKILVVDDEPNNHRVYQRILEPLNLDITHADSGQQALAQAHKNDYFLILMDVQMPEMDGFETAALILQHPKTAHIPVIFITAFSRDETFEFKGYKSGAVDYLLKPINDDILRSKIGVFLTLYKERQKLAAALQAQQKAEHKLRSYQEELKDQISERTQALHTSTNELNKAQNYLVESEKLASLAKLVAGIAHEINTPIGICLTAVSHIHEESSKIRTRLNSQELKMSELNEYLQQSKQADEILIFNLERAAELIQSFKQISVDVSSQKLRLFNLADYISLVTKSLHPELKRTKHHINICGDTAVEITSNPGLFSQIVTNLVMNSILHAYNEDDAGHIEFKISEVNDSIHLNYSDDGKGMSESLLTKIFEPFITTKKDQGGSGLGMYVLFNIITDHLQGTIECTSREGCGSQFNMVFPKTITE
ncbi:hybrid sensor histidine kinase/response regulator [Psychromonas aquimarina]|uniref:hybrid sensor histidine kinase/response regulator n=1 Tax=Psychromonas aquimarina TaxID=444919 RepID=UPI00042353AA|nr:hybrid sensor histidine kinase/response regulator [Psychromonas aquimarina]